MKTWKRLAGWACGLAAALLPGCRVIKNEAIHIWADHFVWEFYDGCNLGLLVEDSICAIYLPRDNSGERYPAFRVTSCSNEPIRDAHPKAVARCEALGDVGFNEMSRNEIIIFSPYEFHKYPYSPIVAVDIRADTTLFGSVPAGDPLNE